MWNSKIACQNSKQEGPDQTASSEAVWSGSALFAYAGDKNIKYCTCPAGRVTYHFHSSCKHIHLPFKSVCNKEHTGVICNMTSWSNSSQSTHPVG